MKFKNLSSIILSLFLLVMTTNLFAQDIPLLINYQGNLTDAAGQRITKPQQVMTFSIWSHETNTDNSYKLWEELSAVDVKEGLFSVVLGKTIPLKTDFFSSSNRYLEVVVGIEKLTPRQQICNVPFSVNAITAQVLSAPDGDPLNAVFVDNDGKIGIGTKTPGAYLDVNGTAYLGYENHVTNFGSPLKSGFYSNGAAEIPGDVPDTSHPWTHLITARHANAGVNYQLQIASSFEPNNRLFFRKNGSNSNEISNTDWHEIATRGANTFSGNQYFIDGNVGIGTSNPAAKLDVNGGIKTSWSGSVVIILKPNDYNVITHNLNTDSEIIIAVNGDFQANPFTIAGISYRQKNQFQFYAVGGAAVPARINYIIFAQ